MYDIVAFGSASMDILIKSKAMLQVNGRDFVTRKGFCLPLGSKVEIDEMFFASGGGGTNAAATFAKQGLFTSFCGMVGEDSAGAAIIEELKQLGVSTGMIKKTRKKSTNHSVILSSENSDRTILVWRGASDLLQKNDIPWGKIKNSRWFYLAPLSGFLSKTTEALVDFAHKNRIKTAMNPGYDQLKFSPKKLSAILKKIDVLIINQEEASELTGIDYKNEEKIFQKLDKIVKRIVIMTKGSNGAVASDGKYLYRAPILNKKVVDRTGAGDSFGSGFVAGLVLKNDSIEKSLQLAVANSAFCLGEVGAKKGLLEAGQKYRRVEIAREKCQDTKYCKIK